jgi:hypothetical protein
MIRIDVRIGHGAEHSQVRVREQGPPEPIETVPLKT